VRVVGDLPSRRGPFQSEGSSGRVYWGKRVALGAGLGEGSGGAVEGGGAGSACGGAAAECPALNICTFLSGSADGSTGV
jgi:hypothetical protein